ncbi:hypothetical protein BGZ76_003642 [Entomortierella beljakovae]|nr:hypothetical protein BGZ76_003642 [Entomortierella beljakovae]
MNDSITPFDIPHIVELIGQYFGKQDLLSCSLVNKTFYHNFLRLLWRDISLALHRLQECEYRFIGFPQQHKDALISHKDLIRNITIAESPDASLLEFFSNQESFAFTNIIRFKYCLVNRYKELPFPSFMTLLERNPLLKTFEVIHRIKEPVPFCSPKAIPILSNHTSLTHLLLRGIQRVLRLDYQALLINLPSNLKTLVLQWKIGDRPGWESPPEPEWPDSYPNLDTVSICLRKVDMENAVIPFISRCKSLTTLKLCCRIFNVVELLNEFHDPEFCPKLSTFSMEHIEYIPKEGLPEFFINHGARLKTLAIDTLNLGKTGFTMFAGQWAHNLSSLYFGPATSVSSNEISYALLKCTGLRKFVVAAYVDLFHFGQLNATLSIFESHLINPASEEWACKDLETLELIVMDKRSLFTGPNHEDLIRQSREETQVIQAIDGLNFQLGKLHKLKHLRLGWKTPSEFRACANIDFSFKRGLRHLEGLKNLEILDLSLIHRTKIQKEETDWIAENWPKLQEIREPIGPMHIVRTYENSLSNIIYNNDLDNLFDYSGGLLSNLNTYSSHYDNDEYDSEIDDDLEEWEEEYDDIDDYDGSGDDDGSGGDDD